MIQFAKRIISNSYHTINALVKLPGQRDMYISDSYYPEYADKRKSTCRIFFDQVLHILKYKEANKFYFLYGLDINGFRKPDEYVDYEEFRVAREKLNKKVEGAIGVLRDKSLFGIVASFYSINTPPHLGEVRNGERLFLFDTHKEVDFRNYLVSNNLDIFCKKTDGECANGVMHILTNNGIIYYKNKPIDYSELKQLLSGRWIIQNTISQHSKMNELYPHSINTIRLVTVMNNDVHVPEVLCACLRIGANGSNVDNWATGGLAVNINTDNGTLDKYAYFKPGYGAKTQCHPNTNVRFDGFQIPYFAESVELAKRFHVYLSDIHSIGWDISITENGPCIIEGNDNWEISINQVSFGLKDKFMQQFK